MHKKKRHACSDETLRIALDAGFPIAEIGYSTLPMCAPMIDNEGNPVTSDQEEIFPALEDIRDWLKFRHNAIINITYWGDVDEWSFTVNFPHNKASIGVHAYPTFAETLDHAVLAACDRLVSIRNNPQPTQS